MNPSNSQHLSKERLKQLQILLSRININSFKRFKSKINYTRVFELIDEALTHTSAKAKKNYERLEFLGDAVLRLTASEFIDRNFPNMKVGDRSALRAQIVSDQWLTTVGQKIGIKEMLILGPKAAGDVHACATLEAEATEALIGAIYELFRDLDPVHKWLTPYWKESSIAVLADPHKQNPKSALQEWSQARGYGRPNYQTKEASMQHGDPKRFFCKVHIAEDTSGEGWGGSRQEAEKQAASNALKKV